MVVESPSKGIKIGAFHCDIDETDGFPVASQNPMSDTIDNSSGSPLSLSRNRNAGCPLCNSKAQLLRVNTLYGDQEDENLNMGLNYEREYSRDNENRRDSDFYLNQCHSQDSYLSPLCSPSYESPIAPSSSSITEPNEPDEPDETDSSFLIEAKASLEALEEFSEREDDPISHEEHTIDICDARYNGRKIEIVDVMNACDSHSECGYNCDKGQSEGCNLYSPRSCPDLDLLRQSPPLRSNSTKLRLKEIKDAEAEQRQRIENMIAASSPKGNTQYTPTFLRRLSSKPRLKTPSKIFQNLENTPKSESTRQRKGKKRFSFGRKSTRRSTLSPSSLARRHRRQSCDAVIEHRSDSNYSTAATEDSSENGIDHRKRDVPPAPSSAFLTDDELQLKRAMIGSARVLTMDGIVESFADASIGTPNSTGQESVGAYAPTSDAPLTWV